MEAIAMTVREQGWLQTIQEAARSGQSTKDWCMQNGIAQSTFYRWKQRLRERALARLWPETIGITPAKEPALANTPTFARLNDSDIPERVTDNQAQMDTRRLSTSLCIRSGELTLELGADLCEEDLSKVLRAVRNAW